MWAGILRQFDTYGLVARVYPAFIVIAPAIWTVGALLPEGIGVAWTGIVAVTTTGAGLYLMSSFARDRGKRLEPALLARWDGWATTRLLRHRDGTVDAVTKARYHIELSKLSGLKLPTIADESAAPDKADEIYRSSTKYLIEARRDPKHVMLHRENAAYGFRRNLLGLRAIGIAVALASAAVTIGVWIMRDADFPSFVTFLDRLRANPNLPLLAGADLLYAIGLAAIVSERFCHQAAVEYAEALFRTLDGSR